MSVTSDGSISSEESYHAPDETPDSRAKQVKEWLVEVEK